MNYYNSVLQFFLGLVYLSSVVGKIICMKVVLCCTSHSAPKSEKSAIKGSHNVLSQRILGELICSLILDDVKHRELNVKENVKHKLQKSVNIKQSV